MQTPPGHASSLLPSQASAKPGRVMYLTDAMSLTQLTDAMNLTLTHAMNLTPPNFTIAKHEICQQSRDEAACEEIYESGVEAGEKSIIKFLVIGSMYIVTCIGAALELMVRIVFLAIICYGICYYCYWVCYWVCYGGFRLGKAALRMIRERRPVPSPLIQPKPWPATKLSF